MTHAASFNAPGKDFLLIKGGSFTMGSPESEDWRSNDETQHRVTLASFYMAKFEVTQKEWREITGKNPSNFTGDKLPVESITWLEAIEFCNALSKVGKHSNANCNPFGKLRFFRQNNHAILFTRRRKIRPEPYSNFKTCTKSNTNRRSFNPLFRRSFSFKRCRKMAEKMRSITQIT